MVATELANSSGLAPHGVWTWVPRLKGTRAASAAIKVSVSRTRKRDENQMHSRSPAAAASAMRTSSGEVTRFHTAW